MNALKRIWLLLTFSIITLTASAAIGDYAEVSAGNGHFMVLKNDGTLWSFGDNQHGQLGDGTTTDRDRSRPIKILDGVRQVSAGRFFTMCILNDGSLWGWGYNGSEFEAGVLGDGTKIARHSPVKLATGVKKVAAGSEISIWLMEDGTLRTTGSWNEGK